jgi:hypothetical protein
MKHTKSANLHIHTYHSDGIHSPHRILHLAKRYGVEVLSITDHNEIRGTITGAKIAERLGLIFFPGIELMFGVKGRVYELLAYFYEVEDIKKFYEEYRYTNGFAPTFKTVHEVVEMIRRHHGAVVVPHPFGRKGIFRKLRNRGMNVDAIEDVNAFTATKRNKKAKNHTDGDSQFLRFGAADMHFFVSDIKKVYTFLESDKEITKRAFWDNLLGKEKTINFKAVGKNFTPHKIFFQKPLCTVVYALNYPRLHASYWIGKRKHKNNSHK